LGKKLRSNDTSLRMYTSVIAGLARFLVRAAHMSEKVWCRIGSLGQLLNRKKKKEEERIGVIFIHVF
jgi:hypothetical protein